MIHLLRDISPENCFSLTNQQHQHKLIIELSLSHFEGLDSPLSVFVPTVGICWTIVINDARQMPIGDHVSVRSQSSSLSLRGTFLSDPRNNCARDVLLIGAAFSCFRSLSESISGRLLINFHWNRRDGNVWSWGDCFDNLKPHPRCFTDLSLGQISKKLARFSLLHRWCSCSPVLVHQFSWSSLSTFSSTKFTIHLCVLYLAYLLLLEWLPYWVARSQY